jgi:anti-sigma regulatory factor (Ser/Thr protein kinase)
MKPIDSYAVLRLAPDPASVAQVRRRFTAVLEEWGHQDLIDDTVLCVGELAANAVLHCREPYEATLRRAGDGVRVEVIDARPDERPSPVPTTGAAADVTRVAATGRGLVIVAALATRWGYTTTSTAKSVWAELSASPVRRQDPVVVEAASSATPDQPIPLRLISLPVRAAVMSGVQVDELVREVQLSSIDQVDETERKSLFDLLDRSAHPRLAGRYTALRAAGRGDTRFDLTIVTTLDAILALSQLGERLIELPGRLAQPAAAVPAAVREFRFWLGREIAAQIAGEAASRCPLPE